MQLVKTSKSLTLSHKASCVHLCLMHSHAQPTGMLCQASKTHTLLVNTHQRETLSFSPHTDPSIRYQLYEYPLCLMNNAHDYSPRTQMLHAHM